MLNYSNSGLTRSVQAGALLIALTGCAIRLHAQAPAPPYALFQYASLTGSGNTINATQVPIVTATGITVYVNLTLQFNVDANGNLTLSAGYPQEIPAPTVISSGFKTGKYAGPGTILSGKALITVSGPGVTDGGATEWSLSSAAGADACTFPYSANWYVGPLASSPLAARLSKAGITSTAWSYGTGSASQCSGANNNWFENALLGVSQVGNTIIIASFSNQGSDYSTPQAQITYTMTP